MYQRFTGRLSDFAQGSPGVAALHLLNVTLAFGVWSGNFIDTPHGIGSSPNRARWWVQISSYQPGGDFALWRRLAVPGDNFVPSWGLLLAPGGMLSASSREQGGRHNSVSGSGMSDVPRLGRPALDDEVGQRY